MTNPPKKSIKEIIASNLKDCAKYRGCEKSDSCHDAEILCDHKKLLDRMKNAYQRRKREKKIDALKNTSTLWRGLE